MQDIFEGSMAPSLRVIEESDLESRLVWLAIGPTFEIFTSKIQNKCHHHTNRPNVKNVRDVTQSYFRGKTSSSVIGSHVFQEQFEGSNLY